MTSSHSQILISTKFTPLAARITQNQHTGTVSGKETMPQTERQVMAIERTPIAQHIPIPMITQAPKLNSPNITPDMASFGVVAKQSKTTFPDLQDLVKLPIADEKVVQGLHKPITSSWRWLAEVCRALLWQGNQKIVVRKDGTTVRTKAI